MENNMKPLNRECNKRHFKEVTIWHPLNQICNFMVFVFQVELKNINEALIDKQWYLAMQEDLNQFERNNI